MARTGDVLLDDFPLEIASALLLAKFLRSSIAKFTNARFQVLIDQF